VEAGPEGNEGPPTSCRKLVNKKEGVAALRAAVGVTNEKTSEDRTIRVREGEGGGNKRGRQTSAGGSCCVTLAESDWSEGYRGSWGGEW